MIKKLKARLAELSGEVEVLQEEFRLLGEADTLDETQEARFAVLAKDGDSPIDKLLAEQKTVAGELAAYERLAQKASKPENRIEGSQPDAPQYMKRVETDIDVRTADRGEARSAALKVLEKDGGKRLGSRQLDGVERMIDSAGQLDGDYIARRLLVTETPAYRSAFLKGVTRPHPVMFTDDEQRALLAFQDLEERSMSEGTTTAGGFGVPVLIDPSIVLTSGATDAPILDIARRETITTNAWKGVSSAGVSWSYDLEAVEVSDDSPTIAQPTVTAYMARGYIPFSIEVGQDYPGFASEMSRLLNAGLLRLLAAQSATGSGTGSPWGIFTAIDQTSASEVSVTTGGAVHAIDALKLWDALPQTWKNSNTHWVANTNVITSIRKTSGDNQGLFTVDLAAGGITRLVGKPVVESDYAPAFTAGTTSNQNVAIVGDFSNFLYVQRAGMTVELVPLVVGTTSNRPTGERGWFAYTRHGFDSIADEAFRLLKNP